MNNDDFDGIYLGTIHFGKFFKMMKFLPFLVKPKLNLSDISPVTLNLSFSSK